MTHSTFRQRVSLPLAILATLVLATTAQAQGTKPFKVTGAGYADFVRSR